MHYTWYPIHSSYKFTRYILYTTCIHTFHWTGCHNCPIVQIQSQVAQHCTHYKHCCMQLAPPSVTRHLPCPFPLACLMVHIAVSVYQFLDTVKGLTVGSETAVARIELLSWQYSDLYVSMCLRDLVWHCHHHSVHIVCTLHGNYAGKSDKGKQGRCVSISRQFLVLHSILSKISDDNFRIFYIKKTISFLPRWVDAAVTWTDSEHAQSRCQIVTFLFSNMWMNICH